MKYAKVLLRFAIMLVFSMMNLFVNTEFCLWAKPRIPVWVPGSVLSTLLEVLLFIYFLCQMALVVYLNARALISGCKKYGIKYQ